jgi:cytoskeleton protein RodZ
MTKVTRLELDDSGQNKSRRIHLREISGDSEAPLETVGQDLRAARLRRGDDLATVSKALKIRKDHLEALEEDRLDALPGRTYAVGFIRSYADYLGLDAPKCVERFKAEINGRADGDHQPKVQVIDEDDRRRMPRGWQLIAVVVVLLVSYGVYYVLSSSSATEPAITPPPSLAPKPVIAKVVPAKPAPRAVAGAATTPPKPGTAAADVLPAGQVYGKLNAGARVVLRVHQPTKVTVAGPDGKFYINRILQRGDIYNVPNVVGAKLIALAANAVEIDLDGKSLGYASGSTDGAVTQSLDPQSLVDHSTAGGPG